MKKYIKSILALATAALLGSSAWAGLTASPTSVTVLNGGTATVTLTAGSKSSSYSYLRVGNTGKNKGQADYSTTYYSAHLSATTVNNSGTVTLTITGLSKTSKAQTLRIYNSDTSTALCSVSINVIDSTATTTVALCSGDKVKFGHAPSTTKYYWQATTDNSNIASIDPSNYSGTSYKTSVANFDVTVTAGNTTGSAKVTVLYYTYSNKTYTLAGGYVYNVTVGAARTVQVGNTLTAFAANAPVTSTSWSKTDNSDATITTLTGTTTSSSKTVNVTIKGNSASDNATVTVKNYSSNKGAEYTYAVKVTKKTESKTSTKTGIASNDPATDFQLESGNAFSTAVAWNSTVTSGDSKVATATMRNGTTATTQPTMIITPVGAGTTTLTVKNSGDTGTCDFTWTVTVTVTQPTSAVFKGFTVNFPKGADILQNDANALILQFTDTETSGQTLSCVGDMTVDYLLVGGGGMGAVGTSNAKYGKSGTGGDVQSGSGTMSGTCSISVGAGGKSSVSSGKGGNSTLQISSGTITANGGAAVSGGGSSAAAGTNGANYKSGGYNITGDYVVYGQGGVKCTYNASGANGTLPGQGGQGGYYGGSRTAGTGAAGAVIVKITNITPPTLTRTVSVNGDWTGNVWTKNGTAGQAWIGGANAEITASGSPTLTVNTTVSAAKLTLKGTGALTVANAQNLTVKELDTSALSGSVVFEFTSTDTQENTTLSADWIAIIRAAQGNVTFRFSGSSASNGFKLDFVDDDASKTSPNLQPLSTHLFFGTGMHTIVRGVGVDVDASGYYHLFGTGASDDNPTVLVEQGAYLTIHGKNLSYAAKPDAEQGLGLADMSGVIRVNASGRLFFKSSGSMKSFNYHQRLYLEPGSEVTTDFDEKRFQFFGGATEGKEQIYVAPGEGTATITCNNGGLIVQDDTKLEPILGLGIYVGEGAKLKMNCSLLNLNNTANPLTKKFGPGELEITGTVAYPFEAADGILTLRSDTSEAQFKDSFTASEDVTYRFPEGWAADALYTLGTGDVSGTAPAAKTATVYVGNETNENYTLVYEDKAVKYVVPKRIFVAADPKEVAYGDPDPTLTATVTTAGGTTTFTDYTLSREAGDGVGEYTITATGPATSGEYDVFYSTAIFTITQRVVTVKADDISVAQYQTPDYKATYTGFVNGETEETVLTKEPSFASGYSTSTSKSGQTFTITPSGAEAKNYSFIYQTGTLTVRDPEVKFNGWTIPYHGCDKADESVVGQVTFTFTDPASAGALIIPENAIATADVLVVGGGGSGGVGNGNTYAGSGDGGKFFEQPDESFEEGEYSIAVGVGGPAVAQNSVGAGENGDGSSVKKGGIAIYSADGGNGGGTTAQAGSPENGNTSTITGGTYGKGGVQATGSSTRGKDGANPGDGGTGNRSNSGSSGKGANGLVVIRLTSIESAKMPHAVDAKSSSEVNAAMAAVPGKDKLYPAVNAGVDTYTFDTDVDSAFDKIVVTNASAFAVADNYSLTADELSKFKLNGVSGAEVAAALLGPNGTFSGGTFALSGSGITLAGGTFTYAGDMTLAVPGGLVLATDVTFAVPANKTLVVSDEMTISGAGKMIVAGEGLVDFLGDKVDVVAQGWTGTVDGAEHAPTVTATLTKFAPDQTPERSALVEYSTDGTTWSITAPAFDAVGQHSVSYRVTVGGIEKKTGSVDVIISKMQDQTISLSLLQSEVKTIEVVGAVPGEEWTAVSATPASVSVSPASGSGKSFHVTFTAGANKTQSPVKVTIKCDSVTYTYNVSVVGAYEENKVNLAYGGEGFADEVTMYFWYQNSSTSFKPRHFQATTNTSNNTTYKNTDRSEAAIAACNAILDVDLRDTTARACVGTRMAAKAPAGSTYIAVWRSSDLVTGLTMGGTPGQNGNYPVVLKPKRVVYVGKTVEAYCYSSVGTGGSGQYTSQAWTGKSADASIATVTASGSAGASFKPMFTGVGVGRTYAIVEDVKETKNATLNGSWPGDTPAEDKVSTANVTNGASYKLWVEVRDIPELQPGTLAASSIVYGQTLADSVITPGTMKDAKGNEVKGTFEWADLTIAPKVSDSEKTSYNVIFTPENEFYDTVVLSVTVKVYAPLTVTANDKEITRGHDLSEVTFDVQYDGFIGGDDEHDLGGKLAFDCAYDKQTALAGEKYAITPKGLTSDKYAITFVDGSLTVVAPVLAEKILTDVNASSGVNAQNLNDEEFLPVVVLENAPYYFDTDATNVAVEVRNASAFVTQDPYALTYGQIARFTLNGLLGADFGAAFLSGDTTFTGSFSTKTGETDVVTFNGGTFTCPDDATVAFAGEIALADDLAFDVADGKVVTIGADNVLSGEGKIVKTGDGLIDFAGDLVEVSAAGWTGIVDGEAHSPTFGVKFTPFAEDNTFEREATVEYSTDAGASWKTEVPAISAIGEHAIQYRVVVAGVVKESGDCDISISKMDDVEETLKLGTDEEDMITCTGAFETDEWTVTTDTDGYEDYFTFDQTKGTGKTFQVIVTTKGELTVKPIWVTIACGSVTYKYKVTVGAAGEEGAINLAYGGSDAADVVKISENNTTSGTPNRRYFKAALTGEGVKIDSTAAERGYYKEWTLTATASNKEAQVSIQVSSGDSDSNYSQTHADKIVTMGKRVAYVGKKLTAYCWSAYNNEWTFTSADPTIATVSGDTAQSTEAYVSITGVKPGKTSITVSNVKKSTSGNATQTGYEYTLWVEVREQPVLVDGTLTTTPITVGEALSKSTITGTMVNSDEMQVDGDFTWDDDTIKPTLADSEKTQYFVIFKPWDASYDEVRLVATVKVERIPVDVPTAQSSFTYDGNAKIGVVGGDGYTLGGVVVATNAGTYTATAELKDNYAWADDKTTTNKFITWTIAAKAITVTAEDQSMLVGGTLPELTYKITNGELVEGEKLVGTLCTTDTLTVGTHDIVQANDWVNPNYDVTFVKGTLTVGAGKVTVNGKGYDDIAAAMDDVTSNGGQAVFNGDETFKVFTFEKDTTLTVADGAWFVTNNLTLAATTVTNDISVSEKLTLAGNVTVGSDDAEAVLVFAEIDNNNGTYKLTLTTNGVVRSATQLDDAVFAEVEHFHVDKKTIADGFEYTLEATEFYVKYYDGDEVVHSNKFTILNYMTDLRIWDGDRSDENLELVKYEKEKDGELEQTDDALRAYVKDEADDPGCDGEVKVLGTWKKTTATIKIVAEVGITDVQTNGESVVGTLTLPAETTEIELDLVKDDLTIPVYKVITNDVTNVTQRVATYAVVDGLTYTFIAEEAEDDPDATPVQKKQAIIDAIDEENKEAVAPKIEAVVDTSDTPAEDKVSAAEMATWITENEIKSADMAQSDFLVASVKLDAVAPITAEDPISVNNSSGTVDQVGIETSIEIAGTPVKEANAAVSVTGIGTNGEEVAVSLDYDEDTGRAQITPDDSKVDSFVATLSVKSDDGTKSIETKIGYLTKPAYKSDTAESKYARELVAVPWASLSDGAAISVADFLVTDNLAAGTKLYSYDRDNDRYNAWELSEAKVWEPIETIVIGKGGIETSSSKTAADAKIAYGEAVWVERADASTPLVFIGDAGEKDLPTSVKMEKGYNFVSFPNIKTDLFHLNRIKNPGAKDFILVPQASGSPRQYTLKDGVWGYDQYQKVGKVTKKTRATDDTISRGSGFEYVRDASTAVDPVVPLAEEEETEEETK